MPQVIDEVLDAREAVAHEAARWRTAKHEAGHAILAIALGHHVSRVSVFDYSGGGMCERHPPEAMSYSALDTALIAAAGPLAETPEFDDIRRPRDATRRPVLRVEHPNKVPSEAPPLIHELARNYHGCAPDWVSVRDWAARDSDYHEWTPRVERIQSKAAQCLMLNKTLLARTARLLYRRGILHEHDIKRLLIPRGHRRKETK